MDDKRKELSKGIRLENSQTLVPWKTAFSRLVDYGNPETRCQASHKVVVWKNESILNGLKVDLSVVYEQGGSGESQELRAVSAYLSESTFQEARKRLEAEFKRSGNFKQLNDIEYAYSWKVNHCLVTLSHLDRFGSFWKIDITRQPEFAGLTQIRRLFGRIITLVKPQQMPVFYFRLPSAILQAA
jgi:hypothetical protein